MEVVCMLVLDQLFFKRLLKFVYTLNANKAIVVLFHHSSQTLQNYFLIIPFKLRVLWFSDVTSAELKKTSVFDTRLFCFHPVEHWGSGEDVQEMLPAPSYRRQQQFPGQLLLLHLGNQGNQGAGPALPGNAHLRFACKLCVCTLAYENPYILNSISRYTQKIHICACKLHVLPGRVGVTLSNNKSVYWT